MSDEKPEPTTDLWAIVEVMGHSQYAGRVSEYTGLGVPLVRVEIPAIDGQSACEKLLGAASIFRITPCSESVARAAAAQFRVRPLAIACLPDDEDLPLDRPSRPRALREERDYEPY